MSGDVYKVDISLLVTGNTTQFFASLSRQILGVHAHAHDLDRRLNSINRRLAVGGAVALAGGVSLIAGLKHVTDHARELSHEMVQLKKLNVGDAGLAEVAKKARDVTDAIKGVKEVEALKAYGSSYSIFGHGDSLKLMGPISQFAQVAGNTSDNYDRASNQVYEMIRAGDLFGKFVDHTTHAVDIDKLKHFLDLGAKVTLGTHGKVDAKAWLGLAQQGGPAMSGMTDKGLLTMAIAAQAMGGPRAGTALTSLYQQMVGGKMTESVYSALMKLDLAGGHMVAGRNGKQKLVRDGVSEELKEALKLDPMEAVRIMQRQMVAHGVTDIEKQVPILFDILGRQTTQRIVHDLLRNMPQIMSERERIAGSMGVDQSKGVQDAEDYVQAERNLKASFENLMTALAGPNASTTIAVMNKITDSLRSLTEGVRAVPPETLKQIGIGLGVLGVALTGGGAVALVAALGPAGWIAVGFIAVTGAFIAMKDPMEAWIRSATGMGPVLDGLDAKFNEAAKAFGDLIAKIIATLTGGLTGSGAIINGGKPSGVLPDELPGLPIHKGSYSPGGAGIPDYGTGRGSGPISARDMRDVNPEMADFIRKTAIANGIDPNVALRIANSEGLRGSIPGVRNTPGDKGTSFGPFQLHYASRIPGLTLGGLGDRYTKETDHHASDPKHWKEQIEFALRIARKEGWGAWHGRIGAGIGTREGIGVKPKPTVTPPPKSKELVAHLQVNLDGRKVAMNTSRHQFNEANGPATAANFSDASEMYPQVA